MNINVTIKICVFFYKRYTFIFFELFLHARGGLWSPSSMQELGMCCDEYDMGVIKRVL